MGATRFLKTAIKILLFAAVLTPFIITESTFFPYIFGKIFFFRSVVEIAFILFLINLFISFYKNNNSKFEIRNCKLLFRNPLVIFLILFFVSLLVSTVFAENSYRAFWGDIERGEGLFGLFHYLVFLVMALAVFEKKDWLNFFKLTLVAGLVIIVVGWLQYSLQYFGINLQKFPLIFSPDFRPISFIGNTSFLATHMFFLIIFAVILAAAKKGFWRYFSLLMIILSVLTVFVTGTRGAMLALAVSGFLLLVYLAIFDRSRRRKLSIGLLILILLAGGVFWSTRSADFWQKIPGLDRFAKTSLLNVEDPSTQTRIITWKVSWNAFKERPILGWGPENYLVAYEKHYDPDYAVYGETWLDRAHNKIFDLMVTQGIFGLVVYLSLLGAILYFLFRKRIIFEGSSIAIGPVLAALVVAYFIQNLFVFDQVVSYGTFFAFLGYLLSTTQSRPAPDENPQTRKPANLKTIVFGLLGLALIFILGYSLYFYNLVPYIQARLFKASPAMSRNVNAVVEVLKRAMYPYNFAQFHIRGAGVDAIYMGQFFDNPSYAGNPKFRILGDLLIDGIDEIVKKEPYDIRMHIREVEMLNGIARAVSEEEVVPLFQKAEKLMREALKRAPNRQEVYYHLAFNLAGQKRYQEAIEVSKQALSFNSNVARAHSNFATILILAGMKQEALREAMVAVKLDPDLRTLYKGDKDNILLIFHVNGRDDKVAELVFDNLNRRKKYFFERKYYEIALRYLALTTDAPNFIKVADYLKNFEDLKEDMEILIDLAEKGRWDIILSL